MNVIGYLPEHVAPGTAVKTAIAVDALRLGASTEARAVIHLREMGRAGRRARGMRSTLV